ncbi:hypothetical protein ABTX35_22255 [Streptomyces sp. NPDC096080]|uniref:hypothetical protein n=1 Tax=Streptomyces sp. NPDC096080 TaxID=3156693 RepID=UPI00331DA05A
MAVPGEPGVGQAPGPDGVARPRPGQDRPPPVTVLGLAATALRLAATAPDPARRDRRRVGRAPRAVVAVAVGAVEPAAIAEAEHRGPHRLHVVLTRAVSRLDVVHGRPLPF